MDSTGLGPELAVLSIFAPALSLAFLSVDVGLVGPHQSSIGFWTAEAIPCTLVHQKRGRCEDVSNRRITERWLTATVRRSNPS